MKKFPFIIFILPLFLVSLGLSPALADVAAKDRPVAGDIVGGFRVLNVTDGSQGVDLTVYRGDYIKFKLADPTTEPVLSIPDLSIQQRLPGNLDEAPYFKMEKSGVFPFVLGTAKGSISVVDYRQANYQEVTPRQAAELIRNIAPLVLDVRTPGEYSRGHMKDSVLIPLQQLQARWQEIAGHKDKDLLIYCATGNRSTVAAKMIIVGGIGEKRAKDLIQRFGSLEALLSRVSEVPQKKLQEALRKHADQARLSKRLATIDTRVPLELSLDDLRPRAPEQAQLRSLFKELEFHKLLQEWTQPQAWSKRRLKPSALQGKWKSSSQP